MFFFHSSRAHRDLHSFPTRRSSDLKRIAGFLERIIAKGIDAVLFLGRCDVRPRDENVEVGENFLERVKVGDDPDRKSTRLNSSHLGISYAVFCLKKKNI